MKKKLLAALLSVFVFSSFIVACSASDSSDRVRSHSKSNDNYEYAAETAAMAGEEVYYEYEEYDAEDMSLDYSNSSASAASGSSSSSASADTKADAKKDMLVYRSTISIDTLEFDDAVTTLKTKVAEYHGFIENENQSDGTDSYGRYVVDEEEKDYRYTATIRIPSEYYDSFVNSTEGLGILRSKNSTVDNVTTVYGTLKSELEIYEAEYDRYLAKYEETTDDAIALEIEREMRNLAITIADIKTRMSVIEGDVAYSYVTITIHKVNEIEEEPEPEPEPEIDNSFSARLKRTAKSSWESCLGFLQGIVLFLVRIWWVLVIFGIIFIVCVIIVKTSARKTRRRYEKERLEREKAKALEEKAVKEKDEKK